jgi:hypothetical protein
MRNIAIWLRWKMFVRNKGKIGYERLVGMRRIKAQGLDRKSSKKKIAKRSFSYIRGDRIFCIVFN